MDGEIILMFFLGLLGNFIGTLAGGGGLLTLPAMIIFNTPVQVGIGANKFSTGIASFTNVIYLWKNKFFSINLIIQIIIYGFIGGVIGALITTSLNEKILNITVIILLLTALFLTLIKPSKENNGITEEIKSSLKLKIIDFFVGIYNGGFGPGSATFGIILYMREGIRYVQSARMARILIFGSNFGAFIIFYQSGYIYWHITIPLAIGAITGAQIGMYVLPKIPQELARKLLIGITLLLIIQVSLKLFS